jgi:magnesium-transporting ATPase (P-type)
MATLIEKESHNVIYIKGAPEKLLEMAQREITPDGEEDFCPDY